MTDPSDLLAGAWRDLSSPDWQIRKQAVQRLSACTPFDEIQSALLDRLLSTDDPVLRSSLIEVLTTVGVTVVPAVIDAMDRSPDHQRKFLIDILAGIGSPVAAPRLIRLLNDTDVNVRHAAIDGLGTIAVPMSGEALLEHIRRAADPAEQFLTLQALTELLRNGVPLAIDPPELASLRSEPLLTRALFDLLAALPIERSLPFVAEWLPNLDSLQLQDAATYFSSCDPQALHEHFSIVGLPRVNTGIDEIRTLLRASQQDVRRGAVWLAVFADHPESIVDELGHEPRSDDDQHVAYALACLLDQRFASLLKELLQLREHTGLLIDVVAAHRDPAYWNLIAELDLPQTVDELRLFRAGCLLGETSQLDKLPALLDTCGADDQLISALQEILPERRNEVMQVLLPWAGQAVGTGNWETLLTLVERLNLAGLGMHVERIWKRAEPELRARALSVLARYRLDFARQYLALGLADRNAEVRLAAAEIMHEIADQKLEREARALLLDREPWLRAMGLSTLARILGHGVVPLALECLTDPGLATRIEAVRLLRTLRAREHAGRVRSLLSGAADGDLRAEVIRFLRANDIEPRDIDVDLLGDDFWRVRYETICWLAGYERFRERLTVALQAEQDADLRILAGRGRSADRDAAAEQRVWFRAISEHVYASSGIQLHLENRSIYERKVRQLAHDTGCAHLGEYYDRLRYHLHAESCTQQLIETITTGETYFFRELSQLHYFLDDILPHLPSFRAGVQTVLWSAGCSTGEEAYTLSILLDQAGIPRSRVSIIAGDISGHSLELARAGIYRENAFRALPPEIRAKYFQPDDAPGRWRIAEHVADRVEFVPMNLVDEASIALLPPPDAIFCRNVLIYFDRAAKERAIRNMWQVLRPDGVLLLGHAESLLNLEHPFQAEQKGGHICYRKSA